MTLPQPAFSELILGKVKSIVESLNQGSYWLADVQQSYRNSFNESRARYGSHLNITVFTEFHPHDQNAKFGCYVDNKAPNLVIFLPAVELRFKEIQANRLFNFEAVFETMIAVDFIHEMDHLALGIVPEKGQVKPKVEVMFCGEQTVWARTCEKTICPFVEKYGMELHPGHQAIYSAWVNGGRSASSAEWTNYIAVTYAKIASGL